MAIEALTRPQHVLVRGRSNAGGIPVPGVNKGDTVVGVYNANGALASSSFESTISVAGQIQQTSGSDLSGSDFWVFTIG
jgi:hypothetical protein